MTGKRPQDDLNVENFARENATLIAQENPNAANQNRGIYRCKDCIKEYSSFQALGGHRASHRNIKTTTTGTQNSGQPRAKPKVHRCKICGKGFAIGQELGGHMRKHWREKNSDNIQKNKAIVSYNHVDSSSSSSIASNSKGKEYFEYDLNLTPHENEEIKTREVKFF